MTPEGSDGAAEPPSGQSPESPDGPASPGGGDPAGPGGDTAGPGGDTAGPGGDPTDPAATPGGDPADAGAGGASDPLTAPEHEPSAPPTVPPVVVPRWIQLVVLPLAALLVWTLAQAAGKVLVIFIAAGVIALVLNPLVTLVERTRAPRGLAVFSVYFSFFLVFAGIVALLVNPVSNQVQTLQRDIPRLVKSANKSLDDVQTYLDDHNIDIHIKTQGHSALETLQKSVLRSSGSIVSTTRDLVSTIVQGAFVLILTMVVSIYFLLYAADIGRLVRRVMPPGDGTPEDDYPLLVQKAVFSYIRGQLAFSLIMGTTAGVALWILGTVDVFPDGSTYALFFGAFFGLMELVPYVGPVLGALPAILVALFQDPLTALWVALVFVAIQQLEGHVVAPQVFSYSLRLNPLLIIFALLFGGEVYGIIGALLALPLAAVARETAVYLGRHLVLEPWNVPPPGEPAMAGATPAREPGGGARDGPAGTAEAND